MRVYLAGPDVFLPNAAEHARRKLAICERYGMEGLSPLNEDISTLDALPDDRAWRLIYDKDLAMMEKADLLIANLTPFRGASADSGTLVELGWFLGKGRPIFGYSNDACCFDDRSRAQVAAVPDPLPGLAIEGFGLPDNLMIPGAVLSGGERIVRPEDGQERPFDSLEMFERCVAIAAARLGTGPRD